MFRYLIIFFMVICGCTTVERHKEAKKVGATASALISEDEHKVFTAKQCNHTQLSNQFDVAIKFKRYHDSLEINDSCTLKIIVSDKKTKSILDSFSLNSLFYFDTTFSDCNNVTSYTTGFNSDRQILDNSFGDIVVADFNFDNQDDIALISDNGGSNGPLYSFYIQGIDGTFSLDRYLTDSVTSFPSNIDKNKNQLTTYSLDGACCTREDVYEVNKPSNQWRHIKRKILGP